MLCTEAYKICHLETQEMQWGLRGWREKCRGVETRGKSQVNRLILKIGRRKDKMKSALTSEPRKALHHVKKLMLLGCYP
jgi:hypothetical protein